MNHSETISALAKITDEGLFERLATAVLRQAEPATYAKLSHPGMSSSGRTKPSPVDGIGFITAGDSPQMVIAHHSIAALRDLKRKWLNNPVNAKTKNSRSQTVPGDVIKTSLIVMEERERTPNLSTTLALTSNQDPSEGLMRDVQAAARLHGITIDVWPGSRIAHYLDNTPDGQWLRRQYLGFTQERISADLLAELSRLSLESFNLMAASETLIDRDFDEIVAERSPLPVAFFIGESGFGKTVACYRFLKKHIESGGYGLVLSHNTVETWPTLDQAIDSELRRLHPSLEQFAGGKARGLCSPQKPFVVLVEDVNGSERPSLLLERLIGWSGAAGNNATRFNWRVLCPVWPRTAATTAAETKKRLDSLSVILKPFTAKEARHAVRQRAQLVNIKVNDLTADRIAYALGNDPLLIGLYDFNGEQQAFQVIETFVTNSIQRLAGNGSFIYSEYQDALRQVAREMLVNRQIDPTWRNINEWLGKESDHLAAMRQIVRAGEIVRLSVTTQIERLRFRHDRVRSWFLSEAMAELMRATPAENSIIAEPFFADVIGLALVSPNTTVQMVKRVCVQNPLALFYALKTFGEPQTDIYEAVVEGIYGWLHEDATYKRRNQALRWAALDVLSETESRHVIPVTDHLKDKIWSRIRARFLNGDVRAGIELCSRVRPGSSAPWRDREIEHVNHRFGSALLADLRTVLNEKKLDEETRIGALRLAGHLADSALGKAVRQSWLNDRKRKKHLDEYLWAAAQCGGKNPAQLLKPICAAWAGLSSRRSKHGLSPRDELGLDELSWAFSEVLSEAATEYFVNRARRRDLRNPIMLMLRWVDQPKALQFIVRIFAQQSRANPGFWHFPGDHSWEWERRQFQFGKQVSQISRQKLLTLWQERKNDKHVRSAAFRLWEATIAEDDLGVLRQANNKQLSDQVLWARIRRRDITAVPNFIEKLRGEHSSYWWQLGRYFWNEELTAALDEEMLRRGQATPRQWGSYSRSDWIVSELIVRLKEERAEALLAKHWEHLHFSREFIQAALLLATPISCTLASEAISACPDPSSIFKYAQRHFYPQYDNNRGLNRLEQIEAYLPYFSYLDDHAIYNLWDTCNRLGWFAFRRLHFDSRLGESHRSRTLLDDAAFFAQLDDVLKRGGPDWAHFYTDRYLEQTDRVEEFLELVEKWLRARMTIEAFDFVAAVLRHVGRRSNIDLLRIEDIQPAEDVYEILNDTSYAVARRSLN